MAIEEDFPGDGDVDPPLGGVLRLGDVARVAGFKAMLAAAVERRVAYVPGTAFYPDGRGTNQLRLAFCHPTDARIKEGIGRLGELLGDEELLFRSLEGR